ncbi:MAG TPA: rhodanese-like domain-containing protein [Burkholderiales bacterium]
MRLSPDELKRRLRSGEELALLDVREQGVHYRGHPFFASCAPLSRLELVIGDLVPRKSVPIVVFDSNEEGLAERAAKKLGELGYGNISVLEGGCEGWKRSGGELFGGVNVPSKAFGEFVEHEYDTPRISPQELKRLQESGERMVVLDSRPYEEFHRMNIPGALDAPGAELVHRVHEAAPDPSTLVVVNCAGRTRSIIGCQSLRNAGIPNRVVALKDGTMGWELAGFACERGATRVAPAPSGMALEKAQQAAQRVARRFQLKYVSREQAQAWQADAGRTLYLLDVRTREEFEACHIAGSRHAPGGQLVQATDEYVGVRNARIVCIDPLGVRSVMTASWLVQMGWTDACVLEPAGDDGFAGWPTERGEGPRFEPPAWPSVLPNKLKLEGATILDFSSSLRFRSRHIPGAWWAVRSRFGETHSKLMGEKNLVLTSEDGRLAHLAAPEAAALWKGTEIRVLQGGNAAWFAAGLPTETGLERATTSTDDVWWKPYDHASDYEKHAREYLSWETALVEQIKRDPSIRFMKF